MGDSLEAAFVSFSTGLLFITLISLTQPKLRAAFKEIFKAVKEGQMRPWTLVAGALGASFVAMQTVISTPLALSSSCAVMKLGKCDFEQPWRSVSLGE